MATSGQVNTNTEYESYFWVKWEQSGDQDIPNNRTLITWSCGVYCGHRFEVNAIKMYAVSINGTQVYGGGTYSNFARGNHTIASGTMWIDHAADGTKTFSISAFSGWLYASHNYSAGATTHNLTQIPRQATITAASDFTDVANPSISFSNPGGFPMDVWIESKPVSDHLCVRTNIPNTGSYTWTLTDAERDALRNKCTGNSCTVRLGLYTYIGGVQYASYQDKTFTMTEHAGTKPVASLTVSPNNSTLPSNFNGLYVQGKSRASVALSAGAKYGAVMVDFVTGVDGKNYHGRAFATDVLTKSGTVTVTSTVKDSRGFTGTASQQITVIPYTAPWLASFSAERQADGTTVVAHLKGGVSPVENKNVKAFSVTLNGVTKEISTTAYTVDNTVTFTNVPTDVTLTAEAKIADVFSAVTKDAVIPTVAVTMDFHNSGTGAAFGKVAEHENLLDVAWDIKYKGNIIADFVIEQGVSDVWTYQKWDSGIAECWCKYSTTRTASWSDLQAWASVALPFAFVEAPVVTCSGGQYGSAASYVAYTGSTTELVESYICCDHAPSDSAPCTFYFQVKGRWK